jgi:hypothetical protein
MVPLEYINRIDHSNLKVRDIGMGHTVPANQKHWVGYAAFGFY